MKIIPPFRNLGCLGFKIAESIYFDFYRRGCRGAGYGLAMFLKFHELKWTIILLPLKDRQIRKWR